MKRPLAHPRNDIGDRAGPPDMLTTINVAGHTLASTTGSRPDVAPAVRYRIKTIQVRVVRDSDAPNENPYLTDPTSVARVLRDLIADDDREHFWIVIVNQKARVIAWHHVSTGTVSTSLVSQVEVFKTVLLTPYATGVILGHNHPSGDPTPSREDIRLTRRLAEAAKLLDTRLVDHMIIGNGSVPLVPHAGAAVMLLRLVLVVLTMLPGLAAADALALSNLAVIDIALGAFALLRLKAAC